MATVNRVLEWITKLAYLNILWLVFTLLGIVVLGLFPSTAATFAVVRKWIMKETDVPVFKTFWSAYKKEFFRSNLLGYVLVFVGAVLVIDLLFFNQSSSPVFHVLSIPVMAFSFLFLLMLFYVFPVFVHYEMNMLQILKNSFFMVLLNPLPTAVMLAGTLGIGFILFKLQGLLPIFGMSALAVALTFPAQRAFESVQERQQLHADSRTQT
ncbi:Uncharacterized membrane protein YesL [Evansella caseinilytica]|uniref:Uncharacterized membrane protein YesL n=1 Tax=Evansella caseinilytica TaxID=1503961 RepID=A0A1H3S086_9BACI|nr:YesL family protein [Evansella caseinilytica]SDZ31250.1 Uncharacterized membrane protein YesL [Evansella caseinilytica]